MTLYALDLFGTAVFAISGVLLACRSNMDFFGALVLAFVTAVGGGTIRDALLGSTPVFLDSEYSLPLGDSGCCRSRAGSA